ncbi:phosphoethanolamine N-methyltransferase 1-like [Actinia tenebrosa]|uniref:phosphoethanolamine N-methyltransferase n=1 Tax=Actinia tenebrosa TaxID=6105 RepID=A0A6P8HIY7_ACTTE|nr:phosphoethanolamine N-methyltransferase 1-like [Actinia tenebrosa]
MDAEKEIKTMKLYSDVERIYKQLEQLGYSRTDTLKLEDVNKFDEYHYLGTDAVMHCIKELGINSSHKVLDFGSGLGGPARFIVAKTNCELLAVELQADLNDTAVDLTKRCGLDTKLKHLWGDILKLDMESGSFDFLVSWLVILHIEDRKSLFNNCAKLIKPGGKMYTEDFYKLSDYDDNFSRMLKEDLFIAYLPTKDEYVKQLEQAGFTDIQFVDVTEEWTTFVSKRVEDFHAGKESYVSVFGQATYDGLNHFYTAVDKSFKSKAVGGCRIIATKK